MSQSAERATALLGREVVVTLDLGTEHDPAVVVQGTLLAWDDGGQAVIRVRDDMGFVHYCWPMLDVVPAADFGSSGRDQ